MKNGEQNTLPLDYGFDDMLFDMMQKIESTIINSKSYNVWKSLEIDIKTKIVFNDYDRPELKIFATTVSDQNIVITVFIGLGHPSFVITYEEDGDKHDGFYYTYDISQLLNGINKVLLGKGW